MPNSARIGQELTEIHDDLPLFARFSLMIVIKKTHTWQFAIGKITSQELLTDPDCAPESAKSVSTSRTAHMRVMG